MLFFELHYFYEILQSAYRHKEYIFSYMILQKNTNANEQEAMIATKLAVTATGLCFVCNEQ